MEIQVLAFNRFLNNRPLGSATLSLQRLLDESHIQLALSLIDFNGRPLKVRFFSDFYLNKTAPTKKIHKMIPWLRAEDTQMCLLFTFNYFDDFLHKRLSCRLQGGSLLKYIKKAFLCFQIGMGRRLFESVQALNF